MSVYFIDANLKDTPTSPNAAYTRLGTTVASTDTTLPQYQFVMDVYESGSTEYIARLTQTPNSYTVVNSTVFFDPSRIFQGELDFDKYWKVTGSIAPDQSVKTFELKIGEQYGTSPSSSVTVYPNQASLSLDIFPGVVNPVFKSDVTFGNTWYFDTGSFAEPLNNPYLTNAPYAYNNPIREIPARGYHGLMNSEDYFTATIFGDTFQSASFIGVQCIKIENGERITNNVPSVNIPLIPPSGSFNTVGIGPKNLAEYDPVFSASLAAGDINLIYTFDDFGGISYYINDKWDGIPYTDPTRLEYTGETFKKCSDEYTRFAFINKYGFWDYYNVYNPVRTNTELERKTYNKPQLGYNTRDIYSVRYIGNYTGKSQYFLRSKDTYSIDTDYINKETANWLEELLESPEVYVQQGSDFVPIVITNSTYDHNNSTARNKLFNYTIEWVYANPRRSRL